MSPIDRQERGIAKEQEARPAEAKREWVKPDVREMRAGSAEVGEGQAADSVESFS